MKLTSVIILLLVSLQTSCVVAGYRSDGGWFFWPGGLGILLIVAILFLFMRRRRG